MRNQYFGDVYDYIKYALIRRLTKFGKEPSVLCWMMTEIESNEGRVASYLEDLPARSLDPPVFDLLLAARDRDERDVRIIERSGLLTNTRFYSKVLTDYGTVSNRNLRSLYFADFLRKAKGRELAVFDPDIGLQGQSTPEPGRAGSSKYLMREEAHRAFRNGHSPLIFVHMTTGNHETDEQITARTLTNLDPVQNATYLIGFIHKKAGFFLVPQAPRIDDYRRIAEQAHRDWSDLRVVEERID